MAYQVVASPLIGVVFDKLNSLIQNKFGEVWGVQKEMKKLSKTLSKIKYVLNDAEQKQVTDEEIRDWLKELKDVAYAAEDVLEEWEFQDQQLASGKVTDSLKELMESFDELAKESGQFDLQKGVVDKGVKIPHGRETGSFLTEPEVYGRDEDRNRLVSLLLAQYRPRTMHPRSQRPLLNDVSSQEDIFVCSILGMGGLGKTTLAQMLYNDTQVADHFQVKSWVCVSDDFNATRLIKAIIVSISQKRCDVEDLDPLQKRLQKELNGKRFLVVLDDVWNDNQNEWNNLKGMLRCGKEGSCVIVTTRLETVASITGTIPPYRLHPLREDHCWSLFKQYAFGLGNKERPALVEIGKEIVARCRGLPLAAKALGGLLRFQNEENQWLSVKESKIWELPQNSENNILSVLELSYNNLPPAVKQCFVYCSIFPKDHEININELIQLWMANGFIQSKGRMELEDVGNEIFHALLWRCFFQDVKKDEGHSILTCKMHDYVHDLASYIAADVDATSAGGDMSGRTRHLSQFSSQRQSFSILGSIQRSSSCLRSLISLAVTKEESLFIFSSLVHIRVLELRSSQIDVVPDCIGKMIHLRYLKLSNTRVKSLPNSMCSLRNFQTLKLVICQELQSLPKDMRNMSSLRHLDIQGCNLLTSTPAMIGELTCLRTLSIFIVGLENGCSIKELQGLNHLGGELTIRKLENVKNSVESNEANLMSKKNLHSLTLLWSLGLEQVQENVTEVIEGLQPHSNLRRCFVQGYQGVNFPSWMTVSALPNLVEITLSECTRCVSLPPLGKLPLLKKLYMDSVDSVKFIDSEVYDEGEGKGFPSLERARFCFMPNLEGWSMSSFVEAAASATTQQLLLPCLKYLCLRECPKMKGPIPFSSSLLHIEMFECNETILGYLRDLPCLSTVDIEKFDELVSFPEGALQNLTSLEKLVICGCKKLKALPVEVENLTTLTSLSIHNSAELVSLGEGASLRNLLSLKKLSISRCPILKRLPKLDKTCLENLYISDCRELELSIEEDFEDLVLLKSFTLQNVPKLRGGFPVALKHAKMLETLVLISCCSKEEENEMDLPEWIGTLTSLQILKIHGCKNCKVLPKGLQNLTALVELSICGCHEELERRCEKDKGEDWFKIAHVPKVYITSQPYGSMNFQLKQMHFNFDSFYW